MELLQVVHSAPAGARSAAVAATDAPAFTAALPNNKIPVAPLVLVAVHLSRLVYVVDAARQLFFAEVVDQPGVFLFGEPHPSMRAVLMAGDLGVAIFCSVILRRYGRALVVARCQVLAETIVLDLANLAQQRLVELFGRRPVVSTPVKDQQLLGLRAVPNDIVRAIQAFQQAFHGIVVVPCLVGNLLDADLVTAAEIGVRIGHAVRSN